MKQLLVLPTWLILKAATPFLPDDHELKWRNITLKDWADHSTHLNDMCSYVFWVIILMILLIIIEMN